MPHIHSLISRALLSLSFAAILTPNLQAQTPFKIPITVVDTVLNVADSSFNHVRMASIQFGLHADATDCFDFPQMLGGWGTHWSLNDADSTQENDFPGFPPNGEAFLFQLVNSCGGDLVLFYNIQQYRNSAQADTFKINLGLDNDHPHKPTVLKWPKVLGEYFDSCVIVKAFGQPVLADMRKDSQLVLPVPADLFTSQKLTVYYKGIRNFPQAPPTPTPISPGAHASQAVTLAWTADARGADYYYLQVSADSTFATGLVVNETVGTNFRTLAPTLTNGVKYYWRVAAADKYGVSHYPASPYRFIPDITPDSTQFCFPFTLDQTGYNASYQQVLSRGIVLGVHVSATDGIDPLLGELAAGVVDTATLNAVVSNSGAGTGLRGVDFLPYTGPAQTDTYYVHVWYGPGASKVKMSWPGWLGGLYNGPVRLVNWGDSSINVDMMAQTSYDFGYPSVNLATWSGDFGPHQFGVMIIASNPKFVRFLPVVTATRPFEGLVHVSGDSTFSWIEYDTTFAYAMSTTHHYRGSGDSLVLANENWPALDRGKIYHTRSVVKNGSGLYYGDDQKLLPYPTYHVQTALPDTVTDSLAVTRGKITPAGYPFTVYFEWGTTLAYPSSTPPRSTVDLSGGFSDTLIGLVKGTVYHYRAVVEDMFGKEYGEDQYFTAGNWSHVLLSVSASWNLVSAPTGFDFAIKNALFPSAASPLFSFDGIGGYQADLHADTLTVGVGYWLRLNAGGTLNLSGLSAPSVTVPVQPGWNLIGSFSSPIIAESLASSPPGLVTSQFFGYDGRYVSRAVIEPGRAYWVKVSSGGQLTLSKSSQSAGRTKIRIVPTAELPPSPPGAEVSAQGMPRTFSLEQNYPNPFNPSTAIRYALPADALVVLKIYNVLGQEVRTLVNAPQAAGFRSVTFDAGQLPSGLYFYRLTAGPFTQVRKMMLLR